MNSSTADDTIQTWIFVSSVQYWLVLIISILSILILLRAVFLVLRIRRSHYFLFLISIVCADLGMLFIIILELVSQTLFPLMKGPLLCKAMHFTSNVAATFVNWTWVLMFVQRFAIVFFPMKRVDYGVFGVLHSSKKLLLINLAFSSVTQSWPLFLITEKEINGGLVVCERDETMLDERGFQIVAIGEAVTTYVLPFLATLATDLAVLTWNYRNSGFTLISAEGMSSKRDSQAHCTSLKIQSSKGIESQARRRQAAIRRCLGMATIQAALNAPHYTLQVADEMYGLSSSSFAKAYFYLDALLYLLYLVQFSIVILYIYQIEQQANAANTNSAKNHSVAQSTTAQCPSPAIQSPRRLLGRSLSHRLESSASASPQSFITICERTPQRHSFRGSLLSDRV